MTTSPVWKQAFEVINQALSMISSVGNTPGINLIPYVATVAAAASALQAGLNAGLKIVPYIEAISDTFSGDGLPSADQIAALDVKIKQLEDLVDAPLPDREEGEPE